MTRKITRNTKRNRERKWKLMPTRNGRGTENYKIERNKTWEIKMKQECKGNKLKNKDNEKGNEMDQEKEKGNGKELK